MSNKMLLTDQGFQKLNSELELFKIKRDQLIARLEEVAQPDESGEDGLATQLKEEIEVVNDKIDYLEEAIMNSQIINATSTRSSVGLGSLVKIKVSGSALKEFHIVSELEADPSQNKISDQSPLGQALFGKKINEEIEVDAPVGKITYKIVSIA